MRLVVTGASSFVGAHVCRAARDRFDVIGLVNRTPLNMAGVETHTLDLTQSEAGPALERLRPDAILHLAFRVKRPPPAQDNGQVSAINEAMMSALLSVGCPLLYASSTVANWQVKTAYGRDRLNDEARLDASPTPSIILRPSAPFGPPLKSHTPRHKESFFTLADLIRRSPIVPMIGDGTYRRQPLFLPDFADAALQLIEEGAWGARFDIGGGEALSFKEIILSLGRAMGRSPKVISLPPRLFALAARVHPDFDPELIRSISEDETTHNGPLVQTLGWSPRPFRSALGSLVM